MEPARLAARPHHGAFPIPYVTHVDARGVPDFRTHDEERRNECAEDELCQLCGQRLDPIVVFIGFAHANRTAVFGEPPMHLECAEWAIEVCPWLAGRGYSDRWHKAAKEIHVAPRPIDARRVVLVKSHGYSLIRDLEGHTRYKFQARQICGTRLIARHSSST